MQYPPIISAESFLILDHIIIVTADSAIAVKIIRIAISKCLPPKKIEYDICDRKKHIINAINPLHNKSFSLQLPCMHNEGSKADPAPYPIRKNHMNEIKFKDQIAGIIPEVSSRCIALYWLSENILTRIKMSASAVPKIIPVLLRIPLCL